MKVFGMKTSTFLVTSVLWLFPRYSELEPWLNGTGLRTQRVNLKVIMFSVSIKLLGLAYKVCTLLLGS